MRRSGVRLLLPAPSQEKYGLYACHATPGQEAGTVVRDSVQSSTLVITKLMSDTFIKLDREFAELSDCERSPDDINLFEAFRVGKPPLCWGTLISENRVVILAEAGAGKTSEIRQITKKLIADGKPAFFLRLEHVRDGLETAFEVGSFENFKQWLGSDEEGWLFLDSVDEARLLDPKDFARAIRKLAVELEGTFQRSHIFITSRTSGWRSRDDLQLCEDHLPYKLPRQQAILASHGNDDEAVEETNKEREPEEDKNVPFRVLTLKELSPAQIKTFVEAKGVTDSDAFLEEVERKGAWPFTSRPLDLEDLIVSWTSKQCFGAHLKLVERNIRSKLTEVDPDRAQAQPITLKKLRKGGEQLAAAVILMQQSAIKIAGASANTTGIDARAVLPEWDHTECSALLARPIFDEAVYGTVRFHHRSVCEFLASKWLFKLADGNSHKRVESLCFREQYGIPVVIPTLRPILPWLALWDGKILEKLLAVAPEVILEGGDPTRIPLNKKRELLHVFCADLATGISGRSGLELERVAVQRFAKPDIAEDIKALLSEHREHADLSQFLLEMVWLGPIKSCLAETKSFATDPGISEYSRVAAIRALNAVGSDQDFEECFRTICNEGTELNHSVIAALITHSRPSKCTVSRILRILSVAAPYERFSSDRLGQALTGFFKKLSLDDLAELLSGVGNLLNEPPVIEQHLCRLSQRYAWLIKWAAHGAERLIQKKHPSTFQDTMLSILTKILPAADNAKIGFDVHESELPELVPEWPELNHALFWHQVALTRSYLDKDERLTDYARVGVLGRLWEFGKSDFERVKKDIKEREHEDDKKIALSLAFQIYRNAGRPRNWREQLKRLVAKDDQLKELLHKYLNPPPQSEQSRRWKRQRANQKRRDTRRDAREKERHSKRTETLKKNIHVIRDTSRSHEGEVHRYHKYLLKRLRHLNHGNTRWAQGNWEDLIADQNQEVAEAFRDWSIAHWRKYTPELRSESIGGTLRDSYASILGLCGLAIEANNVSSWPQALGEDKSRQAFRYAVYEINGFPDWFAELFTAYSETITPMILKEIDWELQQDLDEQEYILHKLEHHAELVADALADDVLKILRKHEPKNTKTLRYALRLILVSPVDEADLREVAKEKIKSGDSSAHLAEWYSMWVRTEPDVAIPDLKTYLNSLSDKDAVYIATDFVRFLLNSHRALWPQQNWPRAPEHLKDLYLLMCQYIREEEDFDRVETGCYSPEPRDEAQNARNRLLSLITNSSGKRAFLALNEIGKSHPGKETRALVQRQAKLHAVADAGEQAWTAEQLLEFESSLEKTPSNHRDLYELAVMRMEDLKDELEHGDTSIASLLKREEKEIEVRKYIGQWLRDRGAGKYSISQEEELADRRKSDFRFLNSSFDGPVPMELKLADNWSGARLHERLENQLCGSYLRDSHSRYGIFTLVYRGEKEFRGLHSDNRTVTFDQLIYSLREHWQSLSPSFPEIDEIEIIGIDLTRRETQPSHGN